MRNINDYSISILSEFHKLEEIHELCHDAYVESGLIFKRQDSKLNLFPHLNTIENTKTLIAVKDNKIIGTNSITSDGIFGLHSDMHFKEETDFFRLNTKGILGSSWRIATNKIYRNNIRLLLDLVQNTVKLAVEMNIQTCLYVFAKKHEDFYKKLIGAETISQKRSNLEPGLNVDLVLMKTETVKTREFMNDLFIRRKF